jgi:2-keto-4-pentenoate hydratase/2-oxohepta-3-ene-1,7-dioic acid hydratase in catechol pathway
MKICRFISPTANLPFFGIVEQATVSAISEMQLFQSAEKDWKPDSFEKFKLEAVKLLSPVVPSKIVCVGRNYAEHAKELGNEVPKEPLLFLKAPSSIIAHQEDILIPPQSNQVEHEGELAVIIKRQCRKLSEVDDPFEYVLGYSCLNDVTARDIQRHDVQFTRGKSFDSFCPLGPFIETALDVADIRVMTLVNDVPKQDGRTSQMVFPVDFLIRYISNQMTLNPGDVIATGTPSGVSKMVDGDICEIRIEGLEPLQNRVLKLTEEMRIS